MLSLFKGRRMSHELLCKLLNAGIGHAQTMRKTELLGSGMSWHTAGMKALFALACIALTGIVIADPLPRASPESQGVASSALDTVFKKLSEIDAVHSTMIVRHGQVIAEGWWQPYTAQRRHKLYSLSKSFTSTAVGMAIAEGKLSLDDTVVSFFPEHAPASPTTSRTRNTPRWPVPISGRFRTSLSIYPTLLSGP